MNNSKAPVLPHYSLWGSTCHSICPLPDVSKVCVASWRTPPASDIISDRGRAHVTLAPTCKVKFHTFLSLEAAASSSPVGKHVASIWGDAVRRNAREVWGGTPVTSAACCPVSHLLSGLGTQQPSVSLTASTQTHHENPLLLFFKKKNNRMTPSRVKVTVKTGGLRHISPKHPRSRRMSRQLRRLVQKNDTWLGIFLQ